MNCEEIRVDMRTLDPEAVKEMKRCSELMFKLNQTIPFSEEYGKLLKELFGDNLGEGSYVAAPFTGACVSSVKIGKNVYVNSNALFMARGGITIGDGSQIAANVQLISNNHDPYDLQVLTCKPVVLKDHVWIGAGATVLPGVCIGSHAVVGAASVVTKDIPDYAVAVGNPARVIKELDRSRFEKETSSNDGGSAAAGSIEIKTGIIEIKKRGITKLKRDAVVNAANSGLQAGSGVCGAIFSDAGYYELQKACDRIGGCRTGSAVITPGFALPAKYIIHAVGPIWHGGHHGEEKQLHDCYYKSMSLAKENDLHSIAFPLISSGIYGYPKKEAWRVALSAVSEFQQDNSDYRIDVTFAVLDDKALALGESVLREVLGK